MVREPQTPSIHLLLEDADFFDELGDDVGLMPLQEAGEREQENLEMGGDHSPSLQNTCSANTAIRGEMTRLSFWTPRRGGNSLPCTHTLSELCP